MARRSLTGCSLTKASKPLPRSVLRGNRRFSPTPGRVARNSPRSGAVISGGREIPSHDLLSAAHEALGNRAFTYFAPKPLTIAYYPLFYLGFTENYPKSVSGSLQSGICPPRFDDSRIREPSKIQPPYKFQPSFGIYTLSHECFRLMFPEHLLFCFLKHSVTPLERGEHGRT
jgi:hypothetical protein